MYKCIIVCKYVYSYVYIYYACILLCIYLYIFIYLFDEEGTYMMIVDEGYCFIGEDFDLMVIVIDELT